MANALPGEDIVEQGLADLRVGRDSAAAFAVLAARPRLVRAGVEVSEVAADRPSHRLYELLDAETPGRAHARHHAIMRRITSYARAAERARAR